VNTYTRLAAAMLLLAALVLPLGAPVLASNVTAADFYGTVLVANNSTAASNVTSNITNISVTSLVNGGYIASASNTSMAMRTTSGEDIAFMPGHLTNTWMTWVDSIPANGGLNYLLYTGTVTGGKIRYFPSITGNMTTADSVNLELGANFTIEQAGYIDTSHNGTDRFLLLKGTDIRTRVYAANSIYVTVGGWGGALDATGITSGEHVIRITMGGGTISIYVDEVLEDSSLIGPAVNDSANDWFFLGEGSMPYMEYQRITIGGNLRQYIVWEYGPIFTDLSGNGHFATPDYAVDSSDVDITATLASFGPVEEAQAPAYSVTDAPDFIVTAPNLTSNFSSTIAPTIPGADVITDAAASSGTPAQLPWVMIVGFVTLALSLTVTATMRSFGGTASVFIKTAVIAVCMGASVAVGVFDFWMVLFFLIPAIAIGLASRPQETLG
jgi:hypothetical protein